MGKLLFFIALCLLSITRKSRRNPKLATLLSKSSMVNFVPQKSQPSIKLLLDEMLPQFGHTTSAFHTFFADRNV